MLKVNAYFKIIDSVINGMKNRFSIKSLNIGVRADNSIQLQYEDSIEFTNSYEISMNFKTILRFKINFDIKIYIYIYI